MEILDLKLDESNELVFNVLIEGDVSSAQSVRLICDFDGISYIFKGLKHENNEIKFDIPTMKKALGVQENKEYTSKLEVIIENKVFTPLQFGIRFKESIKVFAEIAVNSNKQKISEINTNLKNENIKVQAKILKLEEKIIDEKHTVHDSLKLKQEAIFAKLAKK
jgi:hypothetical protein